MDRCGRRTLKKLDMVQLKRNDAPISQLTLIVIRPYMFCCSRYHLSASHSSHEVVAAKSDPCLR